MTSTNSFQYVGFWKRLIAKLIEWVIFSPIIIVVLYLANLGYREKSLWPFVLSNFSVIALNIFLVVKFGGEPGKRILKIRIVDAQGQKLSVMKATCRAAFLITGALVSLFSTWHLLQQLPPDLMLPSGFLERAKVLKQYRDVYGKLNLYFMPIVFLDYLFIAFTVKKRALHDYLAGSYVVEDPSLLP